MLSKFKDFAKNHWKKVVIGGVVVQGVIVGAKYATSRFMDYHQAQAHDMLQNVRRERHFESIEPTFKASFVALAQTVRDTVTSCLDAEGLAAELKGLVPGQGQSKLDMWEALKVMGFTRVLVTIYGTALLNVLLRIQLSIIGGHLFLESTSERTHEWRNVNGIILSHNTDLDKDLQQKYLTLASHLVKDGVRKLCQHVQVAVAEVVGPLGLKQKFSISDIQTMFLAIAASVHRDLLPESDSNSRALVEMSTSPVKYPWKYVFPSEVLDINDNFRRAPHCVPHYEPPDTYQRLLSDTFDLLDSDDVIGLLATFEKQGINNFCDRLGELVTEAPSASSAAIAGSGAGEDSSVSLPSTEGVPLAKIIPLLNRLIASSAQTENDPWLSVLINSEASRTLATNIYESFSNASVEY